MVCSELAKALDADGSGSIAALKKDLFPEPCAPEAATSQFKQNCHK